MHMKTVGCETAGCSHHADQSDLQKNIHGLATEIGNKTCRFEKNVREK